MSEKLCECGCGSLVSPNKRFVQGHYWKSQKHREKLSKIISETNRNRVWTKASREKLSKSQSRKRHSRSLEYRNKLSASLKLYYSNHLHHKKGKPHTLKHRKRIAESLKGKPLSKERKQKISLATKGRKPWNWTGSNKGYCLETWENARRTTLKRDNHKCMLGRNHSFERYKNPDVHHVDGNKEHDNLDNLICLCKRCHAKMQSNLEKSIPVLRAILSKRYGYIYG